MLENNVFTSTDVETLGKLLTAIFRSDRFNAGYLLKNFESATIKGILEELKTILII